METRNRPYWQRGNTHAQRHLPFSRCHATINRFASQMGLATSKALSRGFTSRSADSPRFLADSEPVVRSS